MNRLFALWLSLLLCSPASSQPAEPKNMRAWAKKFKVGNTVVVKLRDKTKVTGKLDSIAESGIMVFDQKNPGDPRNVISYEQIRSLEKKTRGFTWVVLGGAAAIFVGLIFALGSMQT
jgi:hypothetical protein